MTADHQTEEYLELLQDEYARAILRETVDEARSAKELGERCEASLSTVYRRADRLVDAGLLAERRIATPDGTHYSMYEARFDEITVSLTSEGIAVDVTEKPPGDLADRFTDMWEGL